MVLTKEFAFSCYSSQKDMHHETDVLHSRLLGPIPTGPHVFLA